jgi:two-component system, NtrC family, response regulator AtoC
MSRKVRVLLVDDDESLRKLMPRQLTRSGFDVATAANGQEAINAVRETDFDVVLLDIKMPGLSGIETLRQIRQIEDPPEIIMLTADNSLSTGLEAMRLGAYDYLTKPSTSEEIEAVVKKAEEKKRIIQQNVRLRAVVRRPFEEHTGPNLIYKSEAIKTLITQAEAAAKLDTTILITGESGTGKDVLANYIHANSGRAESPMIGVNCGAMPESLFESEFFGHERGAFTGATTLKHGLIEAADNSTLFLDEIGDMPMPVQVKLLHFLEQGRFRRVGSTRDRGADVRVIAATNRDLAQDINNNRFRADLYYRINVVSFYLPPLRERPEDIPPLVEYFLDVYRERFNRPTLELSTDARRRLESYSWPGNIRELKNTMERAIALSTSNVIEGDQILPKTAQSTGSSQSANPESSSAIIPLDELERQHIIRVLGETGGNRERAAVLLGISARTLYRKLREYESMG